MADVKISNLPEVTSLNTTDVAPFVASGITSKITLQNIAATMPQVSSSISASYAVTASYVLNGGGHIIQDSGSSLTQRTNLNFVRMTLSDDSINNATIVKRPPSTTVSSTAPTNPEQGDEWINSDTWKKYVWYLNGGGTNYWVEI